MSDTTAGIQHNDERAQFSMRLQQALRTNGIHPERHTHIAREFNVRCTNPVTVHAVRKWLVGEAIPTQSNLRILASWLGIDIAWLRYGTGEIASDPATSPMQIKILAIATELQDQPPEVIDAVMRVVLAIKHARRDPNHG